MLSWFKKTLEKPKPKLESKDNEPLKQSYEFFDKKNYKQALEYCDKALANDPKDFLALVLKELINVKLENDDLLTLALKYSGNMSLPYFTEAQKVDYHFNDSLLEKQILTQENLLIIGIGHSLNRRYERAIYFYDKAIASFHEAEEEARDKLKFAWPPRTQLPINPAYELYYLISLLYKAEACKMLDRFPDAYSCYSKALSYNYVNLWYSFDDALNDHIRKGPFGYFARIDNPQEIRAKISALEEEAKREEPIIKSDIICKKAEEHIKHFRFSEALECYNAQLKFVLPSHKLLEIEANKGNALLKLFRYVEAIECYEKVLRINPIEINALHDKGYVSRCLGLYTMAIESYNQALAINTKDSHAWYKKAACYLYLDEPQQTIRCCEESLKLGDKTNFALAYKGFALLLQGNIEQADSLFNEVKESKESSYAYCLVGKSLIAELRKQSDKANSLIQQAENIADELMKVDQDLATKLSIYLLQGIVLTKHNLREEAKTVFNKALKLKPDYAPALQELKKITGSAGEAKEVKDIPTQFSEQQEMAKANYEIANRYEAAKNHKEAVAWCRKAAELGHSQAQHKFAECLERGLGIEKDLFQACSWYKRAAAQGYEPASNALKTPALQQIYLLLHMAEAGEAKAQCDLGLRLERGVDAKADPVQAFNWYQRAADQNNVQGQYLLAICLEKGIGTKADIKEAAKLFEQAARQGHVEAQQKYGYLCEQGLGVPKSYSEAYMWYRKAADKGNDEACKGLRSLQEKGYTPPTIMEGSSAPGVDFGRMPGTSSMASTPLIPTIFMEAGQGEVKKLGSVISPTTIPRISWHELTLGTLVGNGSYSDVYQGVWHGERVAIKLLQLKTLPEKLAKEFEHEAELMMQCHFPSIVRLYGVCAEAGHFAMIMEYMSEGSLRHRLADGKPLSWPDRIQMALDIAQGLAYLHGRGILHRDLKSLNVLLGPDHKAKISDFGLAKVKQEISSTTTKSHKIEGTIRWRAPELFKRNATHTTATDVYSLGMILCEIASRQLPYADASDEVTVMGWIKDGEQEKIPDDCPKAFADIIRSCWVAPEKRPKAEDVVTSLKMVMAEVERQTRERAASQERGIIKELAMMRQEVSGMGKQVDLAVDSLGIIDARLSAAPILSDVSEISASSTFSSESQSASPFAVPGVSVAASSKHFLHPPVSTTASTDELKKDLKNSLILS